jgi:hypothetical protein
LPLFIAAEVVRFAERDGDQQPPQALTVDQFREPAALQAAVKAVESA